MLRNTAPKYPSAESLARELSGLPVLSAGRHRNARKGACFMEYASVLAGERWSDHPACTHESVAVLARAVNDCTSDAARSKLAPLIPAVIGLDIRSATLDELFAAVVAARAGVSALPIACESRQRTIAVGLLYARTLLHKNGATGDALRADIDAALATAPAAHQWATTFSAGLTPRPANARHAMRVLTTISVLGIADACVPDADARLERLLRETIAEASTLVSGSAAGIDQPEEVSRKSDPAYANA